MSRISGRILGISRRIARITVRIAEILGRISGIQVGLHYLSTLDFRSARPLSTKRWGRNLLASLVFIHRASARNPLRENTPRHALRYKIGLLLQKSRRLTSCDPGTYLFSSQTSIRLLAIRKHFPQRNSKTPNIAGAGELAKVEGLRGVPLKRSSLGQSRGKMVKHIRQGPYHLMGQRPPVVAL